MWCVPSRPLLRCAVALAVAAACCLGALPASSSEASDDADCRPYFGNACSAALGGWLPRIPSAFDDAPAAPTRVDDDEIVDSGGRGAAAPFFEHGAFGGTYFVYGTAGPSRGNAVYDPAHRIAYFDEGCCSWHHVVVFGGVGPPPKRIAARSLVALRTCRGIALGDTPASVRAAYGPAPLRSVRDDAARTTLRYTHPLSPPGSRSACGATTTFLFDRGRVIAMELYRGC